VPTNQEETAVVKVKDTGRVRKPFKKPLASHITCGQAARLVGVAPRTLAKWADKGLIPGSYRIAVVDGARNPWGDRRVSVHGLREFCRNRNMPLPEELPERPMYSVGFPVDVLAGMSRFGPVALVSDTHALCLRLPKNTPAVIVLNVREVGRSATLACLRALRAAEVSGQWRSVVIAGEDDGAEAVEAYLAAGAAATFESVRHALEGDALVRAAWGENHFAVDILDNPTLVGSAS
jgi:hypothetical protein